MSNAASKQTVNDDTESMNENAVQDAIARGFDTAFLVANVTAGIKAAWSALAYVAAHREAGASRDTILVALASGGISADNASEYIGANAGAFAQRAEAIAVLAHCGVSLANAEAFGDEAVVRRLNAVSWRTAYDARDVVRAAASGKAAWNALTRFQTADTASRKTRIVTAREKAVQAAEKAVETLPETAGTPERKAAEKAVEKAQGALERARKSAAPRVQSEYAVEFAKVDYDALMSALDTYNGDAKGKERATMAEYILMAVRVFAGVTEERGITVSDRAPRARNAKA